MEGVVENSDGTEKAFLVSNSDPMRQGQLTGKRFSGFNFSLEARGLVLLIVFLQATSAGIAVGLLFKEHIVYKESSTDKCCFAANIKIHREADSKVIHVGECFF